MTRVALAKLVAEIIVYGHLILIVEIGIAFFWVSPFDPMDVVPLALISTPTFSLVATSAFKYLSGQVEDNNVRADPTWVRLSVGVSALFVIALIGFFACTIIDTSLSLPNLKYIIGGLETALGAYLGIIRDALFPEVPKPATEQDVVLPPRPARPRPRQRNAQGAT